MNWYRIGLPGSDISRSDLEKVVHALQVSPGAETPTKFVVREPEIHRAGSQWTSENFYDGAAVPPESVVDLVREMLEQRGYWCRLESEHSEVHVGEDVLYVGHAAEMAQGALPANVLVHEITASPYAVHRGGVHPYPPLGVWFWDKVRSAVDAGAPAAILCSWAGGFYGERWFYPASHGEIEMIPSLIPPRSLLVLFSEGSVFKAENLDSVVDLTMSGDGLFENSRILKPRESPECQAFRVSDEGDLRSTATGGGEALAIVNWPEDTSDLVRAVRPDDDGVIRVATTLDGEA